MVRQLESPANASQYNQSDVRLMIRDAGTPCFIFFSGDSSATPHRLKQKNRIGNRSSNKRHESLWGKVYVEALLDGSEMFQVHNPRR